MNKFDEMARTRVRVMVGAALFGCVLGAYLIFQARGVAMVLTSVMIIVQIRIYRHQQTSKYFQHLKNQNKSPEVSRARHYYLMVLDALLGLGFSAAVVGFVGSTLYWLVYELPGRYLNLVGISVLPIGYGAHWLKRRDQLTYGCAEVFAGVATGIVATAKKNPDVVTQGFAVLGAIYVVARGFNNIFEARTRDTSYASAVVSTSPTAS